MKASIIIACNLDAFKHIFMSPLGSYAHIVYMGNYWNDLTNILKRTVTLMQPCLSNDDYLLHAI